MKRSARQRTLLGSAAGVGVLLILIAYLLWPISAAPPIESLARRTGKPAEIPSPIRFRWQFEGATRMSIREVGEDHYACSFPDKVNFFIFKVEGAKGRTLRFSFEGIPAKHWTAIRPVCGYPPSPTPGGTADLNDLAFYEPDEKGQSHWRHIEQMDLVHEREIAYTHKFARNSAYLALRVPHTLGYQQRWLEALPKKDGAEVLTIGRSVEGRPLTLIKIGGDAQAVKGNGCVLMYAGEHPDEPDPSWVVEGAVRFLLGETEQAIALRRDFTFLLIPKLDPDGWARGSHQNICERFSLSKLTPDSIQYGVWFRKWVEDQNALDLVLNFHNPEPRGYPHLLCPRMDNRSDQETHSRALHAGLSSILRPRYRVRSEPASMGASSDRLGSFLADCYGTLHVPYEINSQEPDLRLLPDDLRDIGAKLVIGTATFLASRANDLRVESSMVRARRQKYAEQYRARLSHENPLAFELLIANLAKHEVGHDKTTR